MKNTESLNIEEKRPGTTNELEKEIEKLQDQLKETQQRLKEQTQALQRAIAK
jgi:flagellar capping protein FliD